MADQLEISLLIKAAVDGLNNVEALVQEINRLGGDAAAVEAKAEGLQSAINRLAASAGGIGSLISEIHSLGGATGEAEAKAAVLAAEFNRLAAQQSLIARFQGLKGATAEARKEMESAKARAADLALELRATETPLKGQVVEFERARLAARDADTAYQANRLALQSLRRELGAAGLATGDLDAHQLRLKHDTEAATAAAKGLETELQALKANAEAAGRVDAAKGVLGLKAYQEAQREIDKVRAAFQTLKTSGTLSQQELAQASTLAEARIKELSATAEAGGSRMGNFAATAGKAAVALLALDRLRAVGSSLVDVATRFDRINHVLKIASGNAEGAKSDFEFLRETSEKLGLDLSTAADAYTKFAVAAKDTTLEGEPARKIFESVAGAIARTGGSAEETAGALLALSQMVSKGNVQTEELRGQLGERLPGAFQLAAKAMGVSTAALEKMLQNGQVVASDLLPKLADELDRSFGTDKVNTLQGNLNRLGTAWDQFKKSIADTIAVKSAVEGLTNTVGKLKDIVAANGATTAKSVPQLQDMHDAIVRVMAAGEAGTLGYERYAEKLRQVNLALAAAEASGAGAAEGEHKHQLAAQDAASATKQFNDALAATSKKSGEVANSLGQLITQFDLLKPDNANNLALAMGRLGGGSEGAAKIVKEQLAKAFDEMTAPERQAEIDALAAKTAEIGVEGAQAAVALQEGVRSSFKKLGIDYDEAFSGLSAKIRDGILDLGHLQANLDRAGVRGAQAATIINKAFSNLVNEAQTTQELGAIQAKINELGKTGALSLDQVKQASGEVAEAQKKIGVSANDVKVAQERAAASARAFAEANRNGAASEQQMAQAASDAAEAIRVQSQAYQDSTNKISARAAELTAQEKAQSAASMSAQRNADAQRDMASASETAGDAIDRMNDKQSAVLAEQDVLSAAYIEADNALQAMGFSADWVQKQFEWLNEGVREMTSTWGQDWAPALHWAQGLMKEHADQIARAAEMTQELSSGTGNLSRALANAAGGLITLNRPLTADIANFNLLNQSDLSQLNGAIESARQRLLSLEAAGRSTLISLQNELDSLEGKQNDIERRNYQQRVEELQIKRQEAQASGDYKAVAEYQQSLDIARQIYDRKLADIQAQQTKAQAEQRQQIAVQPVAAAAAVPVAAPEAAPAVAAGGGKVVSIKFAGPSGGEVTGTFKPADAERLIKVLQEAGLRTVA